MPMPGRRVNGNAVSGITSLCEDVQRQVPVREEWGMAGKFEVYPDKSGKYRFRLKAGNGEVVAVGEAYEAKASAHKGAEAVQRAAAGGGKFEVYEDRGGKFRFRLKAGNGEIVATGEAYEAEASAEKGTEAVKRAADGAAIVEVDA
jgi:uncharacterized protein YegP (UPF0339 family)